MKKILFQAGVISLLLIIGLVIVSCGGGSSPSSVVKQFRTAMEKGDTKAFSQLLTPESAELMIPLAGMAKEAAKEQGKVEKMKEEIDGDTAVVTVTFEDGETENYDLVKENNKWKIDLGSK